MFHVTFSSQELGVQVHGDTICLCNFPSSHPLSSPPTLLAVSYWVNKLVDQSLRHVGLADDAFLVVLTYGTAQLVVVHCRSILSLSPQSRHVSRVFDFENTWWESKAVITTQHVQNSG